MVLYCSCSVLLPGGDASLPCLKKFYVAVRCAKLNAFFLLYAGQSENRPSACPVMTFQMGNLWHQHGTIGSGELHFNFTLTRRELLLDTFTFRAFHVISPDHHALLDWETLTGTSQHICLEVTSAMRASQELRKQTLTLVIDILVNGESLCSRNYTAGLNHRNSNASDITMAYMPLETSATVLAFYQRSQTVPFFRSLFASYSRGEYRVVPPATWSRRTVERCRVHRFTLDVTPVGVITPQNITFGVCSGTCRSPLTSPIKFTQNAQLRSLLNAYDHVPVEDRPAMPCCSPPQNSQFEGQTVVVLKSGRPVVWHLPDLIPESCGCY